MHRLTQSLREAVQRLLRRYGYNLARMPAGQVTGRDLAHDLRCLVYRPLPLCLDVGANRGQTIDLWQRTLDRPRIYAFEPSAASFAHLQARGYGDAVSLHRLALGASNGELEFTNYADPCLSSLLILDSDARNPFHRVPAVGKETVQVRTLDWFLARQAITAVDLLKVDTQGYDLPVLQGGVECLADGTIRTVLVELNFSPLYQGQSDPMEIHQFLTARGLRLVGYYEKSHHQRVLAWCTALYSRPRP